MTSTPTSWGLLKQPYKQESTNVDQDGHYYRHLAMIFPSRKPIGKQADHTDGASGGCHQGRPGRNPAPRTSARSNGTTSFSTASTSSIVPGSAKERVLMLYFNTNVGATLVWVNPIDPLAMKTANPRAEPLPEHGEGREVQLGVAMGVSVMLLRIDLGLVVEEPIQNVGCVPFRALDRGAVEGRVVVGDEGVELQRVVAQAMAVRGLQGLPGKEVALGRRCSRSSRAPRPRRRRTERSH